MNNDKDLLTSFQNTNTRHYAFNLLVAKYQQRVYWHIRKMVISHEDASDLTQEVFVKIWNNLLQFRGDANLFTWIYKIASNECLNFISKRKRMFFLPLINIEHKMADMLIGSDFINGDEIQLKLERAILKLPVKQRLVFNLKYHENLTYDEMKAILGTSVGALKASYHHAVKKIEKYLESE